MRLHHSMNLALRDLPRGLEHSGDFDGMMSVIINDGYPVPIANIGEAALNSPKAI